MTRNRAERSAGHPPGRSTAWLWLLAGLVGAVLVVGAVAGALRGPVRLDPDSPEGVVQAYLQAVLAGRYLEASGHLAEETAERCGRGAFQRSGVPDSLSATLEGVHISGGQAEVQVRLRSVSGPLGGGGYSFAETFLLVDEDGAWRLAGVPWPLYDCRGLP